MAGLTGQYMEEKGLKPRQSDFKVYILNSWITLLAGGYYRRCAEGPRQVAQSHTAHKLCSFH